MISQIVTGLMAMVLGLCLTIFARNWVAWFGTSYTAETKIGSGGTLLSLRVGGVLIFFFGLMVLFGFWGNFAEMILSGLGLTTK